MKRDITTSIAHSLSKLGVQNSSSVLIALSGGSDSMTLLFILNSLKKLGHLKKIGVIHINHSLRGKESDKDEQFVKAFAEKLKVPVYSFKVATREFAIEHKIGIEEAARTLRYEKIALVARRKKFQFIATAHTANDQVETVLMNIVRGSGINGLQGIPEKRKISEASKIIRPFLGIGKDDILSFAEENKIPYREDASNELLDYQRNRVRHLVLPKLEQAFKDRNIYSGFHKMTQNISDVAEYISSAVEVLRSHALRNETSYFIHRKMISFDRKIVLESPGFIQRELILREASALSGKQVLVDAIHSELMESFLSYPSNKYFHLTPEIILLHEGKNIVIENTDIPIPKEHILSIGKKIGTPAGEIALTKKKKWEKTEDKDTVYFNIRELVKKQLLIRYWKPGDRMKPFGMKGKSRLISDILSEAGIKSERLKYFVPLIVLKDEPEHILWIPGIRRSEDARLTSKSETALQLKRTIK